MPVKGFKEPGYFLSRTAHTNLRGVAFLTSHEEPMAIAEPVFINLRINFLRVISKLHKSLLGNPGSIRL